MAAPPEHPYVEHGARIRDARQQAGLSQKALARATRSPRRHIIRLENGEHRARRGLLERIAHATGVTVEQLLVRGDDEEEEAA